MEAHAHGGPDDEGNFATACNKCNASKNSGAVADFVARSPRKPVKGRYGEPVAWDGLSAVFVALAARMPGMLTASEREWLSALGRA
ncbi:MAG: HNH endonuclease [Candidatus Rokuibacteriota bacterium]